MGSIHQSKAQQSKKPNPSLLSLASVSPRAPGAEPPSVPTHIPPLPAPTSRRRRPRTGSSRPGPSAPPPPPSGLRLSGGRGSRAGPSPRRRPSRQQQREGGGTSRPAGWRPAAPTSTAPVLHPPCTLGPSIQASQQLSKVKVRGTP